MSRLAFTLTCIVLGGAMVSRAPAQSTHYADISTCVLLGVDNNVSRMQCNFLPIGGSRILRIDYASGECVSTRFGSFSVKQFQIVTKPIASAAIPYQLPIERALLNGGFVSGSFTFSAAKTSIYANAGTTVSALVDIVSPPPTGPATSNISRCTVSLSGLFL